MLSNEELLRVIKEKKIVIKNFEDKQLHPASYDARVGNTAFKTRPERGIVNISEKGMIIIEPGEFVILTTFEHFEIPKDIAVRIGLRSYFARKGLILLSGPQIDPGFRGLLVVGIYNLGPRDIALTYKEPFCTLEFYQLAAPASKPYSGPYQNQIDIPKADIEFFIEAKGATLAEVIQSVGALGNAVKELQTAVKTIERSLWTVPLVTTIAVTVAVAIILYFF
jgi:deoxycytidine triphosphate deaminase